MKIGLDWSGVIADVFNARRLVLMEMYGGYKGDDGSKRPLFGPYHDPDSTIVPFSKEYLKLIEHTHFGRYPTFTGKSAREYLFEDKSDREDGTLLSISLEEYEAMKVVLYERSEYAQNIPEVPGAINAIKKLLELGHEVTIVTSRGPGIPEKVVQEWCEAHDLHVPIVFGQKKKVGILHEYDLFVDDKKRQLAPNTDLETVRMLFMHHYNANEITDFIYANNCGYIADWVGLLRWIEARKKISFWTHFKQFMKEAMYLVNSVHKS